jgi:hypothetical protein
MMEEVMLKWLVVIRRSAIKRRIILLNTCPLARFVLCTGAEPYSLFLDVVALHSVLSWPRYVIVAIVPHLLPTDDSKELRSG